MRRVYLRIAAGVILASIVGWAAVAGLVPLLVGRFEERGFRAPMMTAGVRLLAASIEDAPREQWPARLEAARAELGVALAIVRADSLAAGVTNRLAAGAPAVVPAGRGRPSIYMPLGSGVDVLVAGPLPPLPLEPLLTTAVVFVFVLTFTLSAAVGIPLMRRLRRLRHAISELGSGNLSIRLDPNEGELSELAESINRMASQLQRQFQEREALLQAVSHEMGTPLSRMRFAVEFLEERASGGETDKRIRALTADLDELDRLSSELVAWIETDGSGPRRRVFDVAPVLESLVELECQGSASAARVDLWAAPDLAIHADQRQFQRAIENLLRNALRYAQNRVVVEAEGDGERVVVEVRDDGPGIAAEDRHRVLDPFVRLETSRSGAQRGLGLGLAIVRRIVEAHGGSVVVDEAPEGGTQIRTIWPRGASANGTAHPGQPDRSIRNGVA